MLLHDIHVHTHLSSCAKPTAIADEYIRRASAMGLHTLGFADHFWDEKVTEYPASDWYRPQNFDHIRQILGEVTEKPENLRILYGCETEFCRGQFLGITEERAKALDFILVPHSHTHMHGFTIDAEAALDPKAHAAYLVESFKAVCRHPLAKYITSIAHPFHPVAVKPDFETAVIENISDNDFGECFTLAGEKNIGIELNASHVSRPNIDRTSRIFKCAKDAGCRFSFGSDAHDTVYYVPEMQKVLTDFSSSLGLTDDDLIDLMRR